MHHRKFGSEMAECSIFLSKFSLMGLNVSLTENSFSTSISMIFPQSTQTWINEEAVNNVDLYLVYFQSDPLYVQLLTEAYSPMVSTEIKIRWYFHHQLKEFITDTKYVTTYASRNKKILCKSSYLVRKPNLKKYTYWKCKTAQY